MFAMLSKLRVRHRLFIVCTILALPGLMVSVIWGRSTWDSLHNSQAERLGLRYATAAIELMTPIAKHRGLMASVILKDAQASQTEQVLKSLQQQTEDGFKRLQALLDEDDSLLLRNDANNLQQHWNTVRDSARSMSTADSFAAHTAMLEEIIAFSAHAADRSGLILDPESFTYSLMDASILRAPPTALAIGNVRGMANTLARRGSLQIEDKMKIAEELAVMGYKFELLSNSSKLAITTSNNGMEEASRLLSESSLKISSLNEAVLAQLIRQSENANPEQLFAMGTAAYDSLINLQQTVQHTLDEALTQRISGLLSHMVTVFCSIVLFTTIALKMVIKLCRSITTGVSRLSKSIDQLSMGQLGYLESLPGQGEFTHLMNKLISLDAHLQKIISQVQNSALAVRRAAEEVAVSTDDLSQRTQHQAAALEQTAASVEELTQTVKQNTGNAQQASRLAGDASERATRGGEQIANTITSVTEISQASLRIADIISVIDSIAFQTNLLALNAAVEAARAGDHGRGFAVVAGEVRTLAQRSATAANEIKGIISDSAAKVEAGVAMVKVSGKTLQEIMSGVHEITELVSGISHSSQEQAQGIEEINKVVSQMDSTTQQNAALVEQSSAASRLMADEAAKLEEATRFFVLPEEVENSSLSKPAVTANPFSTVRRAA